MSASILVVDDDPQVLDVFERSLSMAGYAVSTAETGRLAMASIQATEFDLILLDIVMPDMDGLEFLRNLLKQKSKLKIVAMSGMFHGQFLNAAKQLGAKAILPKPISTERLLKVVNETLTEGNAATQDHGEYSVLKLGALDVYLGKSRVRFDPAFTIETENVLSIREDLIWVPVAHDSDGCKVTCLSFILSYCGQRWRQSLFWRRMPVSLTCAGSYEPLRFTTVIKSEWRERDIAGFRRD
jgi:DNA-binding response OmpR family regulator